jgi:aspartyl-tRNA(Asn)/glutamyl-tRNA(Gln) amidotransferase subunit A
MLGKLNCDEFAMGSSNETSAFGPVVSPWRRKGKTDKLVPGGSSGGSSAAVSAGLCLAATATDTGGSIRQPAALTGTVGIKPTYGRCSRWGIVAFASSLHGKRLGLPREYFVAGMEPGVEARVREAVAALEAAGAIVEDVSLPHTDYGLATYYIVAPAEASANLARYDGNRYGPRLEDGDVLANYLATRGRLFGPEVKRRVMLGTYALSAGYYDAYYLKAQKVRTLIKGDFDKLWAQGFDALVAPTSPTVAFRMGARLADPVSMYLSDACTLPVNMAGLPGVSIPCGLSEGLPVGLQLIGAAWSEASLFGLARGYEAITAGATWRSQEPTELTASADPATPTPSERMAGSAGAAAV